MAVGVSARSGARCRRRGHAFGAACMMRDRPPAIPSREKIFESKRPFKLIVMMQRKYPREDSLYIANAVRFGPLTNRSPRLVYPRTGQKVWPAFICVPKRTIWAQKHRKNRTAAAANHRSRLHPRADQRSRCSRSRKSLVARERRRLVGADPASCTRRRRTTPGEGGRRSCCPGHKGRHMSIRRDSSWTALD